LEGLIIDNQIILRQQSKTTFPKILKILIFKKKKKKNIKKKKGEGKEHANPAQY
jgi:hypothetical protein